MKSPQICLDEARRESVREASLNGLDYVEVTSDDQKKLAVYFLDKAPPSVKLGEQSRPSITKHNVRIEGGERIRDLRVSNVAIHRSGRRREDDWMEVTVNQPGDMSPYVLRLVATDEHGHAIAERDQAGREKLRPFPGFDPRYAAVEFSFKPGCPAELDCKAETICPPEQRVRPEINYLAKDYGSFRQLILDRLALVMPEWRERHVPDLGIALVELLAYVGDYLSYYQDAVATEAYLETARKRISVRRHARLVDYFLHEGCNARAWLFLKCEAEKPCFRREEIAFTTLPGETLARNGLDQADLERFPVGAFEYFEPMPEQFCLYEAHNEIEIYTWGNSRCCLPRGTTKAVLVDEWLPGRSGDVEAPARYEQNEYDNDCGPAHDGLPPPRRKLQLRVDDFLLLEEIIGPSTGNPADADPSHRHVVRITRVTAIEDPLFRKNVPGYKADFATPLLEIEWSPRDALPFPLCLSVLGPADAKAPCRLICDVSVARGNMILVDHGRTVHEAPEGDTVPTERSDVFCESGGRVSDTVVTAGKYQPTLRRVPLVFAAALPKRGPASLLLDQDPRGALPAVTLTSAGSEPNEWLGRTDLLRSEGDAAHFAVEIDDEGVVHLRFGDGECGRVPEAALKFTARYRVGGGIAGNIGAESIRQLVWPGTLRVEGAISEVRNPLPARGGMPPEPIAEAKLFAPRAFRKKLERAITAEDYATIVTREFPDEVQRAGSELRWTGSWYSVRVAIDPLGSEKVSDALCEKIERALRRYRRMGHDLQVVQARYVPLDIAMTICVLPHFLRGHVKAALLDIFQSGLRQNGERGFFHPDNLSFGDSIYLSRIVAAVQAVEGVESAQVTKLRRRFESANYELANGLLRIGALEIPRLDGDPLHPENGRLKLDLKGGR
ncbi:MAG: hypothetical protein QOI07_349 [Verrucomicrobiota bacterium]|jgi:hypothetical protein